MLDLYIKRPLAVVAPARSSLINSTVQFRRTNLRRLDGRQATGTISPLNIGAALIFP
jgi:hypothetical protein